MNQIFIIGRLTKNVDVQTAASGTSFTKFQLAQNDAYKKDHTNFFNCTAFGKQAENMGRFLKQGSRICVTGKVEIVNKESKFYTNVIIAHVEFLETKGEAKQWEPKPKANIIEKEQLSRSVVQPPSRPEFETTTKQESGIDYDDIPWEI